MSNSLIPIQKGTGPLFDKVNSSPAKIVIGGVDPHNVDLCNAVLARYAGPLQKFHAQQAQAYSLSNNDIQRGYVDFGDAQATYTNLQGQEMLRLDVSVSALEKIETSAEGSGYFDWALIEIVIPGINTRMTSFDLLAMLAAPVQGNQAWAHQEDRSQDASLTIAQPAYAPRRITSFSSGDQMYSILVDMRRIQAPSVKVQLFALVDSATTQIPDPGPIYTPMQSTITASLFKTNVFNEVTQLFGYSDGEIIYNTSFRWDDNRLLPGRHRMGTVPFPVTVKAGDAPPRDENYTLDNRFGLPEIGAVSLNRADSGAGFNFAAV